MALNVNILGRDSEGNLRALKVNSEGNLEISDSSGWGDLLQDISNKDFATQATLAQVKSELDLVKTELAAIKANQTSGDQLVQVSGNIGSLVKSGAAAAEDIEVLAGEVKEIFRFPYEKNFSEFLVVVTGGKTNGANELEVYFESSFDPAIPTLSEKRYDAVRLVCVMDTLDLGFVRTGWNHANPENIRNMYMEEYKPIIAGDNWRILVENTGSATQRLNIVGVWMR